MSPNIQYPMTSCASENGMTKMPSVRSATASDATNQFWTFCSANSLKMAIMTRRLPMMMTAVRTMTAAQMMDTSRTVKPLG